MTFANPKSRFGKILEGLATEVVGILYGHWSIIKLFDIVCGYFGIFYDYLVNFFPFWYVVPRKIWQPRLEYERPQDLGLASFRQALLQNSLATERTVPKLAMVVTTGRTAF
jgi:hypothetical protein